MSIFQFVKPALYDYFLLGPGQRPWPSLKSGSVFLVGVTNRHSWDADWFARAVFRSCALALAKSLLSGMVKYEIMVLACQVGQFHLTLTQINSEMPWEPQARHETQMWELECHIICVKSNNMYIFCFLCLWWILCDARKASEKSYFHSIWNKVLFCRMFVLLLERDRSLIQIHH